MRAHELGFLDRAHGEKQFQVPLYQQTYRSVLIGSHPVPVGVHLAHHPVPNARRVLMSDGAVSPELPLGEASGRIDTAEELPATEGIVFTGGRTDPAQRITSVELAELLTPPCAKNSCSACEPSASSSRNPS